MFAIILFINGLLSHLTYMGGTPKILVQASNYSKIEMAENCYWEMLDYKGDSVLVVQTVCSPICSSVSGIYTKNGQLIRLVKSPDEYVFPVAQIENGHIVWKDNVDYMLDDVEKNRKYSR